MTLFDKTVRVPVRQPGEGRVEPLGAQSQVRLNTAGSPDAEHDAATPDGQAPGSATPDGVDWQDATMRLKAEMQNYRRRQQRLAEDEATREKARLLLQFLDVVDSLEQSLAYLDRQDPVHQGVQVAYDGMLALLHREGVERIVVQGRMFDPDLHEAVATVPVQSGGVADMHVATVLSQGYRYGDQVLRPAKVLVARDRAQRP